MANSHRVFVIEEWLVRDLELSLQEALLLSRAIFFAVRGKVLVYKNIESLSDMFCVPNRTMRRAVENLENKGLIVGAGQSRRGAHKVIQPTQELLSLREKMSKMSDLRGKKQ